MVIRRQATHVLKRVLTDATEAAKGKQPHECMCCSERFLDPLDGIGEYCPSFKSEPAAILGDLEATRE